LNKERQEQAMHIALEKGENPDEAVEKLALLDLRSRAENELFQGVSAIQW